jgi:tetratricopeptide (TPR) repeat protein
LQSDQDPAFSQGVQSYNQNRFTDAEAQFAKVQPANASEAQKYLIKIKTYRDAMEVANGIMSRVSDELDPRNVEYAIQRYEEAINIKSDGPGHPIEQLQKAKQLDMQLQQKAGANSKAMDRTFCDKAVAAWQEHRFKDAARFSCPLANDDPAYTCNGDEAGHMCEQATELAKVEGDVTLHASQPASSTAFDKAQTAYNTNQFDLAHSLFRNLVPGLKPAADEYLDKISRFQGAMSRGEQLKKASRYEEARTAFADAEAIKPDGPGDPQAQVLEMDLAQGLDQFYSGDYVSATRLLESYSERSSGKLPLVRFYLGASKLARFFITGSEDTNLQQQALNDLKTAKQAGYKPDTKEVSPRILGAYNDLAF